VDPVYVALVVAGMSLLWWRHLRPARPRAALGSAFEPGAEVALHVASHEATTRRQPLTSLHVLYGMLQDEEIVTALRDAKLDPDKLEDRVLASLDEIPHDGETQDTEDAQRVYARAAASAHHAERRASCRDLWAYLGGTEAATLLETAAVDRVAILFALIHGGNDPDATPVGTGDAHVVLRNDDYTTQEFVCEVLASVFGLADAEARDRMLATHHDGRAVIGRYRLELARSKIVEARSLARARGYPLWIGLEST
jgi:ATP-dependent Clp protease adaptor protein ClpS